MVTHSCFFPCNHRLQWTSEGDYPVWLTTGHLESETFGELGGREEEEMADSEEEIHYYQIPTGTGEKGEGRRHLLVYFIFNFNKQILSKDGRL